MDGDEELPDAGDAAACSRDGSPSVDSAANERMSRWRAPLVTDPGRCIADSVL